MDDEYIGCNQAARKYGVALLTLRRSVQRGDLALYTDPLDDRRKLLRVADLEALRRPQPTRPRDRLVA